MTPTARMMNKFAVIDKSISLGDFILMGSISRLFIIRKIKTETYTILTTAKLKIKIKLV